MIGNVRANYKRSKIWRLSVVLVLFMFYGCISLWGPLRFGTVNKGFIGVWIAEESSAKFRISEVDGVYKIKAWDNQDGEQFKVSLIRWDDKSLSVSITMPSTQHQIQLDLSIIDKNNLQCIYSGDRFGKSTWRRSVENGD